METSPSSLDAEQLAREFKEFTYIISHDFNAPLRGVVEISKLLRDEYAHKLDEEGNLYVNMIQQGGEKIQAMLESLLEYSRISTASLAYSPVDCNALLAAYKTERQTLLGIEQEVLQNDSLPAISADANQIARLFQILIDNGFKFHKPGTVPEVKISAQKQADAWQFSVQDNGIGIEPEFQQAVFLLFRKLHSDAQYPGTGSGLTLAKKIVERHGGKIWVESTPGKGTTFKFTLPMRIKR
ncbi:MAG TPA: ATP-binding protein [Rickettsiales bacterium]|nr:ATP-binding protein [Rickettsiales bacterium]